MAGPLLVVSVGVELNFLGEVVEDEMITDNLDGGFKQVLFSPPSGEMIQFE